MMRTALHVTVPREGRTSGTFTELQRSPPLPMGPLCDTNNNSNDNNKVGEDAQAEVSPRLTCSPLTCLKKMELPDECLSVNANTKIMTVARTELYNMYKAKKKEERKASIVAAAEAAAAAAAATAQQPGLREKSPSMGNVINNYSNNAADPLDSSKKSEKRSVSQHQAAAADQWPHGGRDGDPEDDDYNDEEGDEEEEEDEEAKAQEQRLLQVAPRRMQFQSISVGSHYHDTFAAVVAPRVKKLVEFVATGAAEAVPSPLRHNYDGSATRELSDGGTPKIDDHYSFAGDDCASNDGRIPETIKSETIFLYGNSSTDRDGLFAFFLRHTAELLQKQQQRNAAPGSREGGDATFSVIDIYENWGVGDVLDPKDDMHGNGSVRRRSQWSAKAKKRVRHATRRAVSTLLESPAAEGTPGTAAAAGTAGENSGLYTVLGTIDAPGTLRDNPEGQAHHHINAALVWTYYWTSACYDPAYIPGNTSYDDALAAATADESEPGTPCRGSTPPIYTNDVFREGRLHFVLLPNAELKDQNPKSAEELHALSVALKALAAAHHGAVIGDDEPEADEKDGEEEGSHANAEGAGERNKEEDQAAMLACGTPVHEVSETDADFQCRAAIRDSPLLSYLAAVPQSAYSAALWDGAGSEIGSRATSPSISAANSPRRSICGSVRSGRSWAESVQSCVSIADLSGSKARERLRQALGHISLLACLHSGWEQYLEARSALHFLYRCLNLSVPPPSPPQSQQMLELGASSPDVKLPRSEEEEEEEGNVSGESEEARLQSLRSQSTRGTEAPEHSVPMEAPEEAAARDALDSTVASEVSAVVKQPYRRSTTCSPDVDLGSHAREGGSHSPIPPTVMPDDSFGSPLGEGVNRFLSDEFLHATDRRCHSAPPTEFQVATLRPLDAALLSSAAAEGAPQKDGKGAAEEGSSGEKYFDGEDEHGARRPRASPTALAHVRRALDAILQSNEAKHVTLDLEEAKANEAYVETLKTYTGFLVQENEQLRGRMAGQPPPPSPSNKFLQHCLLQGDVRSPELLNRSPRLGRPPLSVSLQQPTAEEGAAAANSSFLSQVRKASCLHPYNENNEEGEQVDAALVAGSPSIGTPPSFFARGGDPPVVACRYLNCTADTCESEPGAKDSASHYTHDDNNNNNNTQSKEDADALQPLVHRLLQVGQALFLQTDGQQSHRRSHEEKLHLFKSILTTLVDHYKILPDAALDQATSSSESEVAELKDASLLATSTREEEGPVEVQEPSLPVLRAEEVEAPIVLVGMSDFQARLRLLDRSLAASFDVFRTVHAEQVRSQQHHVNDLQGELQRLRLRCAAYEEKFTFLREQVQPQVRRDAQELELRAAERQRLQAKRCTTRQAALAEVEARLARLAADVSSW